jgi:hypothetical protein
MAFFLRECVIGIVHIDDEIILAARGIAEWLDQPSLVSGTMIEIYCRSTILIIILDVRRESYHDTGSANRPHHNHPTKRQQRANHPHRS